MFNQLGCFGISRNGSQLLGDVHRDRGIDGRGEGINLSQFSPAIGLQANLFSQLAFGCQARRFTIFNSTADTFDGNSTDGVVKLAGQMHMIGVIQAYDADSRLELHGRVGAVATIWSNDLVTNIVSELRIPQGPCFRIALTSSHEFLRGITNAQQLGLGANQHELFSHSRSGSTYLTQRDGT